jgi:hypothetical protein
MMTDREQIMNKLNHAFACYDAKDYKGYAAAYKHAVCIFPDGSKLTGTEEILKERNAYLSSFPKGFEKVQDVHVVSNHEIYVSDDGQSATSNIYRTAWRRINDGPMQIACHGQFHDKWRKIDGEWWLTERVVQNDHIYTENLWYDR